MDYQEQKHREFTSGPRTNILPVLTLLKCLLAADIPFLAVVVGVLFGQSCMCMSKMKLREYNTLIPWEAQGALNQLKTIVNLC